MNSDFFKNKALPWARHAAIVGGAALVADLLANVSGLGLDPTVTAIAVAVLAAGGRFFAAQRGTDETSSK